MAPGNDMPALMNMSSGTTGLPKGNLHTHRTYRGILAAHWVDIGQRADDRTLAILPLASAAGRSIALATILGGGTVRFMPPLVEAGEVLAAVEKHRIDVMCCVPAILRQLLQLSNDGQLLFPRLRLLLSVGAMLFPEESNAVRARLSPNLLNYYGSTGGGINTVLYPGELGRKPGSVGRPILGNDIEIVDDRDQPLPAGMTGRLRVRCPSTCCGVYPPDPTDASYLEGWHYPGDYALIDEEGYVFLQGRYNDIIIRGGSNVYAPEVERVLLGLTGVREAAVIGVPNAILGEDVVAFVACDRLIERNEIMQHCHGKLAAYKAPTRIHFIDVLPRNSAGKILKRKLLEAPDDRVTPEGGGLKAD
jgi:acyl-coenzyme A synthetase/AMP-(fatty) acid ligase